MNSRDIAAFLAEYSENPLPEGLPEGYVPVELMSGGGSYLTLLCKDADGSLVVVKRCKVQMAKNEADMLARLSHPGLPALKGYSEFEGGAFLMRSYVSGFSLDEYAQRPMTEAAALDLMAQLLEILGYLHQQKPPVVHRDVKPSNIIVDLETGKASLIDLGIARLCEGGLDGDTQGTREFAPPEQYGFMPTTPSADVYAAGKVLLWMLEGREEPLPKGLNQLIRRMTAFDPRWRYPDALAALRALNRYRTGALRKALRTAAAVAAAVALAVFSFWLGRYTQVPVAPMAAIFERDRPVEFPDPVLGARVRRQMGAPEGAVTVQAAAAVRVLNLSASSPNVPPEERIADISALAAFPNLRSLDLSWNDVKDIGVLKKLPQLETLFLNGNNRIEDLAPLKGLSRMKELMLVSCPVYPESAEVFQHMEGLKSFWVEYPLFKDLDVVRYFPALNRLVVKNCGVRDLSKVEVLYSLREIDVSYNPVEDLTPLLKLPHLVNATFSADQRTLVEAQLRGATFDIRYN
jgi:hypothetical protein